MKEKLKLKPPLGRPSTQFEEAAGYPDGRVAGSDEVGRGCLAGPVVAATVILPLRIDLSKNPWLSEIRDSKQIRHEVRERLAPLICEWALSFALGVASVEEIDSLNIFHASHLAMTRSIQALRVKPQHVLVDGKFLPKDLLIPSTAVIQGDQKCLSIAAASIVAKVWRDRLMIDLEKNFPGYGFAQHKGYPTSAHTEALKKLGVSPLHRRSFGGVARLLRGELLTD